MMRYRNQKDTPTDFVCAENNPDYFHLDDDSISVPEQAAAA
jgi:hypothetical protein